MQNVHRDSLGITVDIVNESEFQESLQQRFCGKSVIIRKSGLQPVHSLRLPLICQIEHPAHTRKFFIILAADCVIKTLLFLFRIRFRKCCAHPFFAGGIHLFKLLLFVVPRLFLNKNVNRKKVRRVSPETTADFLCIGVKNPNPFPFQERVRISS